MEMSYEIFLRCITDCYKVTNITKYRSFQLHALVTNIQLKHWGILDTDLCTFCKEERESVVHLFVKCKITRDIWLQIEPWLENLSKEKINFGVDTVISNRLIDNPGNVVNFICLIFKQYLYQKRCLKQTPNFNEFVNKVYFIKNVEKYIAIKNDKLSKHIKK